MKRIGIALVLVALAPACSADEGNRVEMAPGRRFLPATLEVAAGDTITWTNVSDDSHTVTAVQEELPSGAEYFASGDFDDERSARDDLARGLLVEGETFEVTLGEPGTYEYYCIPHRDDGMQGRIVVR